MKIGMEVLPLSSWAKLCQYNGFREVLGSGMNRHLQQNDLLRDIFQMGPAPQFTPQTKASRLERVSESQHHSILDDSNAVFIEIPECRPGKTQNTVQRKTTR